MNGVNPTSPRPVNVLVARHPLLRLLSAYRYVCLSVYVMFLLGSVVGRMVVVYMEACSERFQKMVPKAEHNKMCPQWKYWRKIVVKCVGLILFPTKRDQYLGGAALGQYGSSWQRATGSMDTWTTRLYLYWLPALISTGRLSGQSQVVHLLLRNLRASHRMLTQYFSSTSGKMLANPPTEEVIYYGPEEMTIAAHMVWSGSHWGLWDAVHRGLNLVHPHSTLANVTFTLTEFLQHVSWTHKYGVPDHHWMAASVHCRPCFTSLHYLLHLENLDAELPHLLHSVLGYPHNLTLPRKNHSDRERGGLHNRTHQTNRSTEPQQTSNDTHTPDQDYTSTTTRLKDDLQEFKAVPSDLMTEILAIYKEDFLLLGYHVDQFLLWKNI